MKLAVFVSDYRMTVDTMERLKPEKLGVILVGNGVYHATVKENGKASPLLNTAADFYLLSEDLETRGLGGADIKKNIKIITYSDLVDVIFNEYEKLAWL